MISRRHDIDIVVNGEALEFESQDKINLRINSTLYNPEKVSVTQSEYSFSFGVPCTKRNSRIFGFADIPSVRGKFVRQFDTYVYADNTEIFKGLLRISSIEENEFKCNLINVKNSSIEDIFGELTMDKVRWEIPYLGGATINSKNFEDNPDYFFPLVAYGAFQKAPYLSLKSDSTELTYYTGTNILDKWVKYYGETFIPSPKLIEVVKRMIEQRGYTYSGDVFNDDLINSLYMSSYIDSEQDPLYNWGGDRGKVKVKFEYSFDDATTAPVSGSGSNRGSATKVTSFGNLRELTHPICASKVNNYYSGGTTSSPSRDTDEAYIYNLWDSNSYSKSLDFGENKDMSEDRFIVIPADGYYKIVVNAKVQLKSSLSNLQDHIYNGEETNASGKTGNKLYPTVSRPLDLDYVPIEIQLVKNDSTELEYSSDNKIKYKNFYWRSTYPTTIGNTDKTWSGFPHESSYIATLKHKHGGMRDYTYSNYYFQPKGKTRGYDRYVNEDMIVSFSTDANSWSVAKRGRSWNKEFSEVGYNNYWCEGYSEYDETNTSSNVNERTQYQEFTDTNVPECFYKKLSKNQHYGTAEIVVWLEKNDTLTLKMLMKKFSYFANGKSDGAEYENVPGVTVSGDVSVQAFSPNKKDLKKNYFADSSFDKNLNLGNFLSKTETQKEFFENFLTTFNLNCNIEGNNIDINKNVVMSKSKECVDVDDRIDVRDVKMEIIDFPTSVDVKWTTSDDESGFYHSVSDEHINDDDWKKWADIGSKKIKLIKNNFTTNEISKTSKFSYNWYMDFSLTDYYLASKMLWQHVTDQPTTLSLPIIAKDEDFIDGVDYDDMMKKDGRSLKQRLWFKGKWLYKYVPNRNYAKYDSSGNLESCTDYIGIVTPTKYFDGEDVLRYTNEGDTLLTRYFNVNENVDSNYATIEVYLNPREYLQIRNGAMVRFDNDRYIVCSISGYDATGGNKTKIKMMKM